MAAAGVGGSAGSVAAVWAAHRHSSPATHTLELVRSFPHDAGAFCQGLLFSDGRLFESTGLYGESSLREVELESGRVLNQVKLKADYFAEGIAVWGPTIIQLTWQNGLAFVYDRSTLRYQKAHRYSGEGWGITHDGEKLFLSDGTSTLRLVDPETFRTKDALQVRDGGRPVPWLNELEHVEGEILANVWQSDRIVRISPQNGQVLGWIDASHLRKLLPRGSAHDRDEEAFNGIAFDAVSKRLFVTGKRWPKLFEVRIVPS